MYPDAEHIQKSAFLTSEGNRWFQRNRDASNGLPSIGDLVVRRVASHLAGIGNAHVLEIGCGQGQNLAALAAQLSIVAHGIDPSDDAISAGTSRFPSLSLQKGSADALPYADNSFDVVWFGFCLYLVDRPLLFRVVAEADRVLRDGGLLVILDFDPGQPSRRPYHHCPGLYSYKMDHARLFLANPAYVLVEKQSTSHDTGQWSADPQERVAMTLCRKNTDYAYIGT